MIDIKEKRKAIVVSTTFLFTIIGLSFLFFILPDKDISISERRKLTQMPKMSQEVFFSGEWFEEYDTYMLDQFPFRNQFRTLKAISEYYLFAKADNNDIYISNGYVCKQDYPLNEKAVINATEKMNTYYSTFFSKVDAYYCIIPDKNQYLAGDSGHLCYDYDEMFQIVSENIDNHIKNIDIKNMLSMEDYYRTDLHWTQQEIVPVADYLLEEMKNDIPSRQYDFYELSPFYGSYFGQVALPLKADVITYFDNNVISSCRVYNPLKESYNGIYEIESFGGIDSYDIFLSGAEAILMIENPNSRFEKELYIIRDSFASSITPLLIENYAKIVLIDPRYISCEKVSEYLQPSDNASVLFLFSTIILNNGYLFK